ncbi:universal stress protein [uncultured Roseobacter sp.]|uniref:universal stress protein n=2 Tax=uncultured Roseobacter sp. TaxID=114847 RepID=UPI0026059F01|nr:universal stress protein [uncultured Roseobacter sp.]
MNTMGLKTLLVCLTTTAHAETLMKLAVPLARKHDAHLIGLHTVEALVVYPGIAIHIPEPAFAAFNESQKKEAEAIKAIFAQHTENEDFQSEFRLVRAEAVSANERMVESARAADLVIMAHEDDEADRYDQRKAQTQVIRESGRPVIVVPLGYDGPAIGANLLLGWSDTREAARAAHDLLAVADEGAPLTVLRVGDVSQDPMADADGIDVAEMFSRHGLKPTLEHRETGGEGIAAVLNQVAFEKGADLIVTGAFGHSKAYDFVIGATTYALLRYSRLPVMFSK